MTNNRIAGLSEIKYLMGKLAGIAEYAYFKNGVQYVGTCGTKLRDAEHEVYEELRELLKKHGFNPDTDKAPRGIRIEGVTSDGSLIPITIFGNDFMHDNGKPFVTSIYGWRFYDNKL